jgi:hypothetical protein
VKVLIVAALCVWSLVLVSAPVSYARDRTTGSGDRVCKPNPKPTAKRDLPPELKPFSRYGLIGEGVLWTIAPRQPGYVAGRGIWAMRKQPWLRLDAGELAIGGRRINGRAGGLSVDLPPVDAYPLWLNASLGPGFIPSGFEFSTGGCWKVTARLANSKVVLYVNIDDSKDAICADLAAQLRQLQGSGQPDGDQARIIASDQSTRHCPA